MSAAATMPCNDQVNRSSTFSIVLAMDPNFPRPICSPFKFKILILLFLQDVEIGNSSVERETVLPVMMFATEQYNVWMAAMKHRKNVHVC
jgi:hypothetical protein